MPQRILLAMMAFARCAEALSTSCATRNLPARVRAARPMASWGPRMSGPAAGGGRDSAAVLQDESAFAGEEQGTAGMALPDIDLNPPRGTRDFYPPDMRLRNWLFGHFRAVSLAHGFEEYDAPVLETEALYVRKAGEEVTQQLYNFPDKQDRRMALRPEMTPSLARMVLNQRGSLPTPIKWFSVPQCWRYERTTRGRRREHFQWNMDIWGVPGISAEAELLAAVTGFCTRVGLTPQDVGVKLSSRRVLTELMAAMGVPPQLFTRACIIVDKLDKIGQDAVKEQLADLGLGTPVCDHLFEVLAVDSLDGLEAVLGADSPALSELRALFVCANSYGFDEWLQLDLTVVRGLAYYTGVVFEGFDKAGQLRAIFGGGRYDTLLSTLGAAEPMPAVGFGFGDAVIVELLRDKGLLPKGEAPRVEAVVFALDKDLHPEAMRAARVLRDAGNRVDLVLESKKTKWVFKHAERLGAGHIVVIGSEEVARGVVAVKDLTTGEQRDVPVADLSALRLFA